MWGLIKEEGKKAFPKQEENDPDQNGDGKETNAKDEGIKHASSPLAPFLAAEGKKILNVNYRVSLPR
ncbi:MAG: hypothetical protein HOE06_06170 [Candidatus Thioglobus sp.]|nr:hypothetical protein [Candidatus Thioglobus sp.]